MLLIYYVQCTYLYIIRLYHSVSDFVIEFHENEKLYSKIDINKLNKFKMLKRLYLLVLTKHYYY